MHRLRRIHILLIYLSCALFCVAVVHFFLPRIQHVLFKELAQKQQDIVCRIVSVELDSMLGQAKLLLRLGTRSPQVIQFTQEARGNATPKRFDELLHLVKGIDAYRASVLDFLLLDTQGDIISASSSSSKGNRSVAPYFTVAMRDGLYLGIPGNSARTGSPVLRVAEPVLSGGIPVGVLVLTLDLGKIMDNWRRFLEDSSRQAIFLMDAEGKILVHSDIGKLGTEIEYAGLFPRGESGEYTMADYIRDDGVQMFTYRKLPLTDWTVVVSSSEEALLSGGKTGGSFAVVFATAFLVLFLGLCVPLQAIFYAIGKKAFIRGQQSLLIQSMEDSVMGINADGLINYASSAAEHIARVPGDQLVGSHVHSVLRLRRPDGQSASEKEDFLLPHLTGNTPAHFQEQVFWRVDGSSFVGNVSLYPLNMGEGPRLFLLRLCDMTSECDAEERIRAVYRAADNVFIEYDEYLHLSGCTEESVRLFGASDAQALLDDFFYRFSPPVQPDGAFSAQTSMQYLKRAFEEGFCRFVWMHRTQEGAALPCEITLMRLLRGGRPGLLAHVRDLRFLLGNELTGARQSPLLAAVNAIPVGMGIAVAGQCRFANPALRAMAGMRTGEAIVPSLMNVLNASQAANPDDARSAGYIRLPGSDSDVEDFLWNSAVVEYEGENGVVFCLTDISEQKCLERGVIAARETAEAAVRARERFLAVVSHEVRTPLNGVMGILQLASLQEMESGLKEHLNTALSLCKDLLQILSDILDLSKIESGSLSIVIEEFSPDDVACATLASFQDIVRDKGIALHCSIDPSLPKKLLGDAGRVRQLLLNLVGNAVKYTQEGQIELEILRVPACDAATLKVLFAVNDTGVGIPVESMVHIFEPFQRGNGDYVLRQGGVGLGLAIVRRLVRLMAGEFCMFSGRGGGTETHLILPFELPDEAATASAAILESASADEQNEAWAEVGCCAWSADSPRILVVDDEAVNLTTMQLLLGILGYPSDVTESGTQALQMMQKRSYTLVFMDIQMPEVDGYETAAATRAAFGADTPTIVALTAHVMHGDKEKMLNRGFDEYMAKPVILNDLKELLYRLIGRGD